MGTVSRLQNGSSCQPNDFSRQFEVTLCSPTLLTRQLTALLSDEQVIGCHAEPNSALYSQLICSGSGIDVIEQVRFTWPSFSYNLCFHQISLGGTFSIHV
uniref:Uncharacterized protein n=1 Tax=Ascaris lumbricoides TaxID=6252 RepID=A0A0M3HNJ1_ASCLU